MAGRGYASEDREPTGVFTPSVDSDDDMQHIAGRPLPLGERNYRLFQFRKEGRSWANAPLSTESTMSESEIKKRARRAKKPTHTVDHQLDKMSAPRRMAIEDLLDDVQRRDRDGDRWDIVAIDNDSPERTKRTGEVLAFSVTLARVGANTTRQRTGSLSQNRRTSAYLSPDLEYAGPERRRPKSYYAQQSSILETREQRRSPRRSDTVRRSQPIFEDDPFGSTQLFSGDGKPVNPQGSAAFTNGGLPPHIPLDEPIGAKPQKQEKQNKSKKSKKGQDDDVVDLDALLGNTGLGGDPDDVVLLDDHDDQDLRFDSPIEVFSEKESKSRGRKRADSGWHEKAPKRGVSRSKSKSKPRRPSIHIPNDDRYARPHIPEVIPAGGRRRQPAYWGSHGSATTQSIHSDQSVLEAEYEEYSSSGSSAGWQEAHPHEYSGHYMPADGRYVKATKDHRRGPPSPQYARYDLAVDQGYVPQSATHRRPRQERFPSDGAIQRYSHTYTPVAATRPPLIMQHSAPRFTPIAAHPAYTYDTGITPYPSDMVAATPAPMPDVMRRRESMQAHEAQLYMQRGQDRDREVELLQRERDVARREAEMHHEIARRVSERPTRN
ncbi:hypothetical protein LTR70_006730 [Exophiala xenobiotica]|uniref:Uncharacterized protein n=1 Tax=Lithohypha guttulata TaxID=1690604 RepID=A0ABR0KA88_9EURO|nr:hypothetical protein LTR24_004996 [Lithohypha guttulata]KAK5315391.1 hypothetical protein LTR70_006730 [Exophiala xenobiotica]